MSHNGDLSTKDIEPAVALALNVVFGDSFVSGLDRHFARSLAEHGTAWGEILTSLWRISTHLPSSGRVTQAIADTTQGRGALPDIGVAQRPSRAYGEIRAELVAVLEEATGYPAEILEDDADLDADLAIDSVKQVEALATLRERYGLAQDSDFMLQDHRTIRRIVTHLAERLKRREADGSVAQ
jgi:acyl carrier protein